MSLSNRNSTAIVVDGTSFRWTVSARSQYKSERVTLVVQPDGNGTRLAVEIPCRDPYLDRQDSPNRNDVRSITPELVRRIILESQSLGWKPYGAEAQFEVRFVASNLQDAGGEDGATCHICWQCPLCNQWFSDDVEYGVTPPVMTSCGRTKNHDNGMWGQFVLFW